MLELTAPLPGLVGSGIGMIVVAGIIIATLTYFTWASFSALPPGAPKLIRKCYPLLGVRRFFTDRSNFYYEGVRNSKSGHFSFHVGQHLIVAVSGLEGRRLLYESKSLSMSEGYAPFFPGVPRPSGFCEVENGLSFSKWSSDIIVKTMRNENLEMLLPQLVGATKSRLHGLIGTAGGAVLDFDPFDFIYRTVYHLTVRAFSAHEIAESPAVLDETLIALEQIEAASSPARAIFPWLPRLTDSGGMSAGMRLHAIFGKIIKQRKESGLRCGDAFQRLLDSGQSAAWMTTFVLDTLFSSQFNSGMNAAWMFSYLACNPEWYSIVQQEVDSAIASNRTTTSQTSADVLATLTLEQWEVSFPMLNLCLRECIRLHLVGVGFRKNVSGRSENIGKSGESVPKDAFVVYLIDEIHMSPRVYTDPHQWDPSRYLSARAEDKQQPLSWLGWGLGRNPCLGMRLAKLKISIVAALVIGELDYELIDIAGNKLEATPSIDRNKHAVSKPDVPVRLRCKVRSAMGLRGRRAHEKQNNS